jgi:hypothetical protein
METGIEEGTFAFPKLAPFTYLVFRQKRRLCKSVVSPKEAHMQMHLPSFFTKCRDFLALTIQQMN